ncbi:MAG: thioester domain-containing protein [Roseiflexaceae bacterium]
MSRIKGACAAWLARHAWRGVLVVLVALGFLIPGLALAQTLTGTFVGKVIGREVAFQHKGKAQNDWAGVLKLKLDDGTELPVFCIQIEVRVRTGDRYRSDGPVLDLPNGCQIRYLLDKYPASTASDVDEAAARQMAIWVFSDNVDPMTIQDIKIRDRTIALVNEARLGPCPLRRTAAPTLTLDPSTVSASAGQPVAYIVRAGALDAGQTLSVSVAGPAVLTDASGAGSGQLRQNVTLDNQGQANFWVTGTGVGPVTVRVDLSYLLEAGTVFSQIDDNAPTQRLVMAESRVMASSATAQIVMSAGAPPPSPTPLAPTPLAPAPPPPAPPHPTDHPSHHPKPTATQAPPEQSTEQPTAVSDEQATAIPTPVSADTTAIPGAAAEAAGQALPVSQPAPPAARDRASQPIPSSLPTTAAPETPVGWLVVVGAGLLALGGWLLRRRFT